MITDYLKAVGGILIATFMCVVLIKHGRDFSLLITVAVCCAISAVSVNYLKPVVDFIQKLQSTGSIDAELVQIILKAVGIGLLAQITNMICVDSGNASLGKGLQVLATTIILCLSIPLFNKLLELAETILGRV